MTDTHATENLIRERVNAIALTNPNANAIRDLALNDDARLLPDALRELEGAIRRTAAIEILESVAEGTLTNTQIRAVFYGAILRRVRAVDYFGFEMMFRTLRTIRDESLANIHPAGYAQIVNHEDRSWLAMAEQEAGVSPSIASDIMTLGEIVLPYLEEELGIPRAQAWAMIPQTNLRAMLPVLRIMINLVRDTGDTRQPAQAVVENATEVQYRWMADELGVDIIPNNETMRHMTPQEQQQHLEQISENRRRVGQRLESTDDNSRIRGAINWLIDHGANMTTRDFSHVVGRRNATPFDALIYRNGALVTMAAQMTAEQFDTVQQLLRARLNYNEVETFEALLRSFQ